MLSEEFIQGERRDQKDQKWPIAKHAGHLTTPYPLLWLDLVPASVRRRRIPLPARSASTFSWTPVRSRQETSGGKRLNLAFYATVFSPQGKMIVERSQKVDQAFRADVYKQILEKGLLLHMDIDPQPGNDQLRLAVQDNQT